MSEENDFSCINDLPCEEYIIYFIYLFILLLLFFFQISYRVLFLSFFYLFIIIIFFPYLLYLSPLCVCMERNERGGEEGEERVEEI